MSAVLTAQPSNLSYPSDHLQRALVVDDKRSNRMILRSLLEKRGYQVIEAENGAQALELFGSEHPDIVFMDVIMPVLDGLQAVERIRQVTTTHFVPIIFVSAMSDDETMARCIEAGGDDFLARPFNERILTAKIHAMERIRQLNDQVNILYGQMKKDEELAEGIFSGAVVAGNVAMERIHTLLQPAEVFSGDVLLSAYAPSGDLNVILGDFTGHGLAAALGALPASEVFRAMTGKGFSPTQILGGINKKLHNLMPVGMFFAVQFISISHTLEHLVVCNCGMPDILLLNNRDGQIKHRFSSRSLPLSITTDIDFTEAIEHYRIERGDRVMLNSDGVVEARDPSQRYFGQQRLQQALEQARGKSSAVQGIADSLARFCRGAPQDDDISLAEVPCLPEILPHWDPRFLLTADDKAANEETTDAIEFSLTLTGKRLRDADPIPLMINQIQEMENLQSHRRLLFTILTELYVNALDHGVLQLDSGLKASAEGFTRYFSEREKRLEQLDDGFISIRIHSQATSGGGRILLQVEDSGDGFDFSSHELGAMPDGTIPSGRGLMLLRELCDEMQFTAPGNKVDVVFSWSDANG